MGSSGELAIAVIVQRHLRRVVVRHDMTMHWGTVAANVTETEKAAEPGWPPDVRSTSRAGRGIVTKI